ncbi:MAG TPA: hypothetical protein EYP53_09835 [Candidatus Latescibacteria bacterium]|nr:hypothetical protein [Candidatus Latescibacterota bacterium]
MAAQSGGAVAAQITSPVIGVPLASSPASCGQPSGDSSNGIPGFRQDRKTPGPKGGSTA